MSKMGSWDCMMEKLDCKRGLLGCRKEKWGCKLGSSGNILESLESS